MVVIGSYNQLFLWLLSEVRKTRGESAAGKEKTALHPGRGAAKTRTG